MDQKQDEQIACLCAASQSPPNNGNGESTIQKVRKNVRQRTAGVHLKITKDVLTTVTIGEKGKEGGSRKRAGGSSNFVEEDDRRARAIEMNSYP